MFVGDYFIYFFANMACVSGALSAGRNRDCEGALFYYTGDEKITKFGTVDDIAEYLEFLTIVVNLPVDFGVIGSGDDEDGLV